MKSLSVNEQGLWWLCDSFRRFQPLLWPWGLQSQTATAPSGHWCTTTAPCLVAKGSKVLTLFVHEHSGMYEKNSLRKRRERSGAYRFHMADLSAAMLFISRDRHVACIASFSQSFQLPVDTICSVQTCFDFLTQIFFKVRQRASLWPWRPWIRILKDLCRMIYWSEGGGERSWNRLDNLDVSPVQCVCVSVSVRVCMMKAVYHFVLLIV